MKEYKEELTRAFANAITMKTDSESERVDTYMNQSDEIMNKAIASDITYHEYRMLCKLDRANRKWFEQRLIEG